MGHGKVWPLSALLFSVVDIATMRKVLPSRHSLFAVMTLKTTKPELEEKELNY